MNIKSSAAPADTTREERLAAALRENLKRRKAQSRDRDQQEKDRMPKNDAAQTD